jgi:hypothetical protein
VKWEYVVCALMPFAETLKLEIEPGGGLILNKVQFNEDNFNVLCNLMERANKSSYRLSTYLLLIKSSQKP